VTMARLSPQEVANRLSASPSGNGWNARCPAHDDHHASLSIGVGDDGRVLLYCHAGCAFKEIVAASGLDAGELFPGNDESRPAPKTVKKQPKAKHATLDKAIGAAEWNIRQTHPNTKVETVYEYGPDIRVIRFTTKDFIPVHQPGDGWYVGKPDRYPLYRTDRLAQLNQDGFVYFVEGEKDADRLNTEGLVATTMAGGAKGIPRNLEMADLSPLHNHHVILVPDKDKPGTACMVKVAEILLPIAKSVRVAELSGLPEHGDVSDWLDEGNDPEDLWRLAEDAETISPQTLGSGAMVTLAPVRDSLEASGQDKEPPAPLIGEAAGKRKAGKEPDGKYHRLITRRASDIEPKPIEWFWDQRIPANSLNLLIGMPNTGKSTLTMDIAARVSTGTPWPIGDDRSIRQGSVLILSAEDQPEQIIVPRLKAAGADLDKVFIVEGVQQLTAEEASDGRAVRTCVDVGRDAALLEQYCDELGDIKLIIIDPLDSYIGSDTDVFRGNEARAALAPLKDIAEQRGVTVIIAHHFNKAPTTNVLDRVSGSRSFGALPRSVWIAAADETDCENNRTIFAPAKWNMSRNQPTAVAYSMKSSPANLDIACVAWESEELDIGARELMNGLAEGQESDTLREAKEFLVSLLALGNMDATEVKERAKHAGVSIKSLETAARRLKVQRVAERDAKGVVKRWVWSMP